MNSIDNTNLGCKMIWNFESEDDLSKLSQAINLKQYEINLVVADLKDYLTNMDIEKRAHGIQILSSIMKRLSNSVLTEIEVQCILDFYLNRLKDKNYVVEKSIPGLTALCHNVNFNFSMANSLFLTIQNELAVQVFKPECKVEIYELLKYLFDRFQQDFVESGASFVYGFLRIIDSETSPICLIIIFEMFYKISIIKDFESHAEDIFDSMACYFPIIYSSKKNDKHYETKLKLSELLNRAMSASVKFSEFVIQIVMEKLESESIESKISCYKLLQSALPKYCANDIKNFVQELWVSLRIDILRPSIENDDLAQEALIALRCLSETLSDNVEQQNLLIQKIWKDLEISLKAIDLNLTYSTVQIFVAVSSKNHKVFSTFFERSYPILLQNCVFSSKEFCYSSFQSFFVLIKHGRSINFAFNSSEIHRFVSLQAENQSSTDISCKLLVISIFNNFIHVADLDQHHLSLMIYYMFASVQQSNFENDDLMNSSLELISSISAKYHQWIGELFLSKVIEEIELFSMPNGEKALLFNFKVLSNAAQELNVTLKILSLLVGRFIFFLSFLEENNSFHEKCMISILECFHQIFVQNSSEAKLVESFYQNCIKKLLDFLSNVCFLKNLTIPVKIIQEFARLLNFFLQNTQNEIVFQQITNQIFQMIRTKKVYFLNSEEPNLEKIDSFVLDETNPCQMNLFLNICYAYFFNSKSSPLENILLFKEYYDVFGIIKCLDHSSSSSNRLIGMIQSQIILKITNDDQNRFEKFLEVYLEEMKSYFSNDQADCLDFQLFATQSLMWISKSLFKIENQYLELYVRAIMDLYCQNPVIESEILSLVDIIYSKSDFFQSVFSNETLIPTPSFSWRLHEIIMEKFEKTKDDVFFYLVLTHFKFCPAESLPNIENLSLVTEGLKPHSKYLEINKIGLALIMEMIKNNQAKTNIENSITSVLKSTIELSLLSPAWKIRKMALDCIILIIETFGEKPAALLNFREDYVQSLRPCLDDRKRLVRASAVKANCKMIMLGQPGNRI